MANAATTQHGIMLTWTPSTTAGVQSQVLFRGTTAGGEDFAAPLATFNDNTTNSFLDTTGVAGQEYFYVIEAVLNGIDSVPSDEASAMFPTVPAAPTGLTAVAK